MRRARTMRSAARLALAAAAILAVLFVRDRRARWVHETALPSVRRLVDADQLDSAFALATRRPSARRTIRRSTRAWTRGR